MIGRTCIVVTVLLSGLLTCPNVLGAFKHLREGMTAPDVSGIDVRTGETVSLSDHLEGVTILVFWATWSERSLQQLSDLKTMTDRFGDNGLKVMAVNVEEPGMSRETRARVVQKTEELDLPFPVIIDENLTSFYEYGVIAVPSTAVLNKEGIIEYGPAGYSYTIRDRLQDSTEVMLGLKEATPELVATGRVPEPRAGRYYFLALRLYNQRMYERAMGNIEMAVQADSGFAAPLSLRGEVELALGRPEDAAGSFAKAADLDDGLVAAWAGWGRCLVLMKEYEEATVKLKKALELDESYTPAMVDLAIALDRMNTNGEAMRLILSAHELNRTDASINHVLGLFYLASGNRKAAVAVFQTALENLFPNP